MPIISIIIFNVRHQAETPLLRFVADLLCRFVVQLVAQQIHNKSKKWSIVFRMFKLSA